MSTTKSVDREAPIQGALVIHPVREGRGGARQPDARLQEAVGLALALDLEIREAFTTPLRRTMPATLFGKGKVEEVGVMVEAADAAVVVVDDTLSPIQ